MKGTIIGARLSIRKACCSFVLFLVYLFLMTDAMHGDNPNDHTIAGTMMRIIVAESHLYVTALTIAFVMTIASR